LGASPYCISRSRACLALAVGALTGASATGVAMLWISVWLQGIKKTLRLDLDEVPTMFALAMLVWAVGLIVFGAPAWWLLHRIRMCRSWVAAVLGGVLSLLVYAGLRITYVWIRPGSLGPAYLTGDPKIDAILIEEAWWFEVLVPVSLPAIGVLVATVIWRIAYGGGGNGQSTQLAS
jgi:hypothetical protein